MKPHLIIKCHQPISKRIPYWEDILLDKHNVAIASTIALDQLLMDKYKLPYWLTYNYQANNKTWNSEELKSGLNRVYRLILQQNTSFPKKLIQEIKLLPEIERVEVGGIASTTLPEKHYTSAQSLFPKYRVDNTYLREAHQFTKGDPRIKIAILDTGFETKHPEIAHSMLPGKDFVNIINGANQFVGDFLNADDIPEDAVGHGTHVAGIISAKGMNMPIGVAPECKIIPIKVLGALKKGASVVGAGLIDNINNGIKWAVDEGADVINMSLGIKKSGDAIPHEDVIRYALAKGVTIVAATGNDGTEDEYFPGALSGVVAVGASDNNGLVAPFSTYGKHVSLIAPGMNIFSSFLHNGYALSSGTSQASPFVAGAIALLKSFALSKGRTLNDQQIKYLIKHTSDKISNQFKDIRAGFGRINLWDALKLYQHKM